MSTKHIPALDGVRGLAVLLVLLLHLGGGAQAQNPLLHFTGITIKLGWSGVTLFFVLSGFLITGILHGTRHDPHRLRNFYLRRSLRIFPLYYLALFLALIAAIPFHEFAACLSKLPVTLLYLQNVLPFGQPHVQLPSPLNTGHFWSLAVEEQFYLLWPFLVYRAGTRSRTRGLCIAVVFASACWKLFVPGMDSGTLAANAGALALGGWIALEYGCSAWHRVVRLAPYVLAISFALFIPSVKGGLSANGRALLWLSFFWGSLLVLALSQEFVKRMFSAAWLRWIGSISYGLYVYHLLFLRFFDWLATKVWPRAGYREHLGLRFVVAMTLSFGISWLSFHYLEKPISRNKRKYAARPEISTAVPSEQPAYAEAH